ncbi:PIN domain-containing protein [Rhizobium sp.]|uniref:PIN domain-containing protein n=1 Tax=Rhizobium sp. TaxID=391 RepID=UPI0034C66D35
MKRSFLVDTCVISETRFRNPDPAVTRFLTQNDFFIPAVVLVEIQQGIMEVCSSNPLKAVELSAWYQRLFSTDLPILPLGREVAEILGTLVNDRRLQNLYIANPRKKRPRLGLDLHIAAFALAHRLPIATHNIADFCAVNACYPLPGIYSPREDRWYAEMEPLRYPDTHSEEVPPARRGLLQSFDK